MQRMLAAAAIALAVGSPAMAVTAVSGSVGVDVTATIASTITDVGSDVATVGGLPGTLSAFAGATASNVGTVDSFGSATATWASANAGSVTFRNFGWIFETAPGDEFQGATINGINWYYSFTTGQAATLTVNYAVTTTGSPFGLQGWYLYDPSAGTLLDPRNVYDPTASGSFTYALAANQSYTLTLENTGNVSTDGTLSGFAGAMNGTFDWTISEVPEPGTWAMMIAGFGLVGAAARRRRTSAVAA